MSVEESKRIDLSPEDDWVDRQYIAEWGMGRFSHVSFVRIEDLSSGPYSNAASLTAEEALKLLTWLEQEKPLLEEISRQDDV